MNKILLSKIIILLFDFIIFNVSFLLSLYILSFFIMGMSNICHLMK